jgi:hypothetical protein
MANNVFGVIICRAKIGFLMEDVKWKMEDGLFYFGYRIYNFEFEDFYPEI